MPPLVLSATAIDVRHVNVLFNESLLRSSVENTSHYVILRTGGGGSISVLSAVLLPDGKTVSLETSAQSAASYVITVSDVKDVAGNQMGAQSLGFDGTTELDTTAPVVASTFPENEQRGVDTTTTIVVEFSEKMNRSSVEGNFNLEREFEGVSLPGAFAWEMNDTRVIFTPEHPLRNDARYDASIGTGAADVAGNPLASPYDWSFVAGNGGAISGTVTYTGMPPYNLVRFDVFSDACFTQRIAAGVDTLGSYLIDPVPSGTCYVGAFMDQNQSGEPDIGEPAGIYDPNGDNVPDPITVSARRTRTGVNFELKYEFQFSTISGTVSKSPEVTQSDTTYVAFLLSDTTQGSGPVAPLAIVPAGTGPYVSSGLPFGCYYVICYMDTNHNHELDLNASEIPIEPVGIYFKIVQGEPVLTPILLITDVVEIDMTLIYATVSPSPSAAFAQMKNWRFSKNLLGGTVPGWRLNRRIVR